jgi:uncharacterized protein YceK|nr:hypothetical protein [uncultured Limnohabitans sp.]
MKLEVLTLLVALLLSGCGASDDDWASKDPSAKAASTQSFDITQAWTNFNLEPQTAPMTISGSCTGTLILTNTSAMTVSGAYRYNQNIVNRLYNTCIAPFVTTVSNYSTVAYFNYSTAVPLLKNVRYTYGTTTNVWRAPADFPSAAKVGDSGLIGVIDNYTTASPVTKAGLEEWTYVIEMDTASSVVFNLIVKAYSTTTSTTATDYLSAPLIQTEQYRYRVGPNNTMKMQSYDIEKSTGFKTHAQ